MPAEDKGIDVEDGWQELNPEGPADARTDLVLDHAEEHPDPGKSVHDYADVEGELR